MEESNYINKLILKSQEGLVVKNKLEKSVKKGFKNLPFFHRKTRDE